MTKTSATINWNSPSYDGGSPVTEYIIERRQKPSTSWVKVTSTEKIVNTTFSMTDLTDGSEYEVRIIAVNKEGPSQPSAVSAPFTAKSPHSKIVVSLI